MCLCDSVPMCACVYLLSWRFGEVQSAIASSAMKSHIDSSKDSLEMSRGVRVTGAGGSTIDTLYVTFAVCVV